MRSALAATRTHGSLQGVTFEAKASGLFANQSHRELLYLAQVSPSPHFCFLVLVLLESRSLMPDVGLRTNVDSSGLRLYPKSSRRMSKITLEHICSSRRHVLISNLIRLIDHTIFDPCVGPCCPSEHDFRGPPRGVAGLVGHAARATHARAIAPLLPSHRLHCPSLFLLRLFRPLAHSPTRASTSKAASRSQSTEAYSPQRKRAATRALFTQGAPAGAEYQTLLAETQAIVECAVTLLIELVRRCEGLDNADPELARYALDLHELGLKNIIIAPDDPTRIVRSAFSFSSSHFSPTISLPP